MAADISPTGSPHDEYVEWCLAQNVEIQKVRPAYIAGRGMGILATEAIKEGTQLVLAPPEALFTVDCLPEKFIAKHPPDISIHSLLASFIVNGSAAEAEMGRFAAWKATWPSYEDFARSMPLLWPKELRKAWNDAEEGTPFWPMPCIISGEHGMWDYSTKPRRKVKAESLVHKQERKLAAGLAAVQTAFPNMRTRDFTWAWLIVNTRSFFYDLTQRPARKHADKMILCPFMDYFNHADTGCLVEYDERGYSVTADRDYPAGAELYVSYGAHDSDLMLAEYGFVPASNKFDSLCLDPWVLAPSTDLERRHSRRLAKHAYLDSYYIVAVESSGEVCWRTQTAVRATTMRPAKWSQFIRGKDLGEEGVPEAHGFIRDRVLIPFRDTVAESVHGLRSTPQPIWDALREKLVGDRDEATMQYIRDSLILRWEQMLHLIDNAISALKA